MATSQLDNTTGVGVPALLANVEETVPLSSEAVPVVAAGGDVSASSINAVPADHEQSLAETAPVPATIAGPSTAVEHDPAPIQPPIQPVSASNSCQKKAQYGCFYGAPPRRNVDPVSLAVPPC